MSGIFGGSVLGVRAIGASDDDYSSSDDGASAIGPDLQKYADELIKQQKDTSGGTSPTEPCSEPCNPASPCFKGEAACGGKLTGGATGKKTTTGGGGGGTAYIPPKSGGSSLMSTGPSMLSSPWLWVGVAAIAAVGIVYATSKKKHSQMRPNRSVVFYRRK